MPDNPRRAHDEDEQYVAGLTASELRDILNPTVVQSLRENPLWRQPGYVSLLFALDLIDRMETEHDILIQQTRAALDG
jgi:hypothetical protein